MANNATFVLDTCMTMAWCFDDEVTEHSELILDSLSNTVACVPSIWPLEVTNVLLMAVRRKRLTKVKATGFLDKLSDFPIEIAESKTLHNLHSIFQVGYEKKITTYDASYLELAITRGLPLATLDKQLIKAAKSVGIKIL